MKTKLICLFIIAFGISAYSQKKSVNLDGAWKLVHSQTFIGDSSVNDFPGISDKDGNKFYSGNNFMFVTRVKIDTTVEDWYGVGTFKLEGNKYEETLKIIQYKPWEGTTIKMILEIKNDTLIQTYPVDNKGQMDKNWAAIEKYVRIKK